MEIIPSINCPDIESVREYVGKAGEFAGWIHLDVSDARFTFNKSWGDSSKWHEVGNKLKLEVHLMVEEPKKEIDGWLNAGANRIIIHLEAITGETFSEIKKKMDERNTELMIALNPETPSEKVRPYFERVFEFQILAVYPGPAGQKFLPLVADKIRFLRQEMPNAIIEVDGGINEETAKLAKDAGANIAVSASYIFANPNPKSAYEILKSI